MNRETSDEMLMAAYQNGDFSSFRTLYSRYSGRVYGYLKAKLPRGEVEDVFQNIFSKLHEKKHKFRSGNPFAPWFFTIAHHAVVDAHRKRKTADASVDVEGLSSRERPAFELAQIAAALNSISSDYRQVIQMRYFEGRDFEEIASSLSLTSSNVRQKLSRGIKKLRDLVNRGDV